MSTLLTVAELRTHVETDLVDNAVQRLLDDVDAEIIDRLGPLASQTEVHSSGPLTETSLWSYVITGNGHHLYLRRKAASITSVVERINQTNYTLGADDYLMLSDGRRVERLQGSTYPALEWSGIITIIYAPVDETASRKRLEADLVKLAAAYSALSSQSVGDVKLAGLSDYQAEREKLFRALRRNRLGLR